MTERPDGAIDGDPFGGREPTSHERMTGRPWDASYEDGPAPWDIGRPQPAFARLAAEGRWTGTVLDAGCGTGEHALLAAQQGLTALGFDVAERALAMGRQRAAELGVDDRVELVTADALALDGLGRRFDTVLDSGLFHTFDTDEQPRYTASLATVTEPGGTVFVLCFRDGPDAGPHPVREDDLRTAFAADGGWEVISIEPDRVHTRFHGDDGAPAWLATIRRAAPAA